LRLRIPFGLSLAANTFGFGFITFTPLIPFGLLDSLYITALSDSVFRFREKRINFEAGTATYPKRGMFDFPRDACSWVIFFLHTPLSMDMSGEESNPSKSMTLADFEPHRLIPSKKPTMKPARLLQAMFPVNAAERQRLYSGTMVLVALISKTLASC
jgi:hypothetical protein